MFDFIIKQVHIVDGTGSPWFVGDVALQDDKIAAVASQITGEAKAVIDGRGLTLTPGFIDIHSHSDFSLPVDGSAESHLLQGITTQIGGNCGMSPAPAVPERTEMLQKYTDFLGGGLSFAWTSLAEFLDTLAAAQPAVNFGTLVGHGTLRIAAMGFDNRAPKAHELEHMQQLLAASMEAGAFGMSTGLIYAPGCYADTDELVAVASAMAPYDGIYESHMRDEGENILAAIDEAAAIGRRAGVRVQIAHHKVVGRRNWGKGTASQKLIARYRAEGLDIANDQYPYVACSTTITTIFPAWSLEGGVDCLLNRLQDATTRVAIRNELIESMAQRAESFADYLIAQVNKPANKHLEGVTIEAAAAAASQDPCEFIFDLMLSEGGNVATVNFVMCEDDVKTILQHPLTMIGSDGSAIPLHGPGKPHPRGFSSFIRVLTKYVQEGVLSFEEGVRKMTSLPASRLHLFTRGLIRPGCYADLVLLDRAQLQDRATFANPRQQPSGICKVWVNGRLAVDDGHPTGIRAGQILRYHQ